MIPRAILTDIEGTTSSIVFVHEVLFPYSRGRLADYVARHQAGLGALLDEVRAQAGDLSLDTPGCIALLAQWHDEDCKIGPLKALQGRIWAQGYASGELKGHIYADAAAGLLRWHDRGITLAVYSSGSVAAQKLLFGHSEAGDLNPLFAANFDIGVGGKKEAGSYRAIARALDLPPAEILFLSDVEAELDAASGAGMQVTLLVRDGAPMPSRAYPTATSFETIVP